jgi:hypothetical protein
MAGCTYTSETTVKVRDPAAVQIDVDDPEGKTVTVLPAGGTSATLPNTMPPWAEGLRPVVTLNRKPGGPLEVICDDCSPKIATLVDTDGVMNLGPPIRYLGHPFTKKELRVAFRDQREGRYGSSPTYGAELVTPWTNVVSVRRVETPDRGMGVKLLASAAIVAILGGFALEDGFDKNHSETKVFGFVALPFVIPLAAGGAWYMFAPPVDHPVFGEK